MVGVEEDVVAGAAAAEVVHDVVDGDLDVVGGVVDEVVGFRDDVEFAEADARVGGEVEYDAVFLVDGDAEEFLGVEEKLFVESSEAYELHVRVADGAAGHGAVVFEEDDGAVFAGVHEGLPVTDGEVHEAVHVVFCVVGHVGLAVFSFDEDELVGVFEDVEFVFQQDDVAVCVDDVRQVFTITEGAGVFFIDNVFRLLFAECYIKAYEVDFHGVHSPVNSLWKIS